MKLYNLSDRKVFQVIDGHLSDNSIVKEYEVLYHKALNIYYNEKLEIVKLDDKLEIRELNVDPFISFQIFGSKSSTDYDVMIFLPHNGIPKNEFDATSICKGYNICLPIEHEHIFDSKKPMNCNLSESRNFTNHITKVYKGTEDECNNSLIDTYNLHPSNNNKWIIEKIPRDIQLKALRSLRVLLSFLSRTKYRSEVKKALKGDVYTKIETLEGINLTEITSLEKRNIEFSDYLKTMAFQIGQTNALMADGVELYTKESIIDYYPYLQNFLRRNVDYDLSLLEDGKQSFLDLCKKFKFTELYEYDFLEKNNISN